MSKIIYILIIILMNSTFSYSQDYKVDPEVQKKRDTLRLSILNKELEKEYSLLSESENKYRDQIKSNNPSSLNEIKEEIGNHKNNIAALQKEIEGGGKYSAGKRSVRVNSAKASPVMLKITTNEPQDKTSDGNWWDVYARNSKGN